jgi:5-methylcytosine-specific restriction endonuclease McrA
MNCARCGEDLGKKPAINVEGSIYCYKCSKKEVAKRQEAKRDAIRQRYESEKKLFDEAKTEYTKKLSVWEWEKHQYVYSGIFTKFSGDIRRKREHEFLELYPPPKFDRTEPKFEVPRVHHSPQARGETVLLPPNYREEILRRDKFTCQSCGQKKKRKNLEVHHITQKSKDGPTDPTNLVTVCKYCHDRENWYEHVRKFPTTTKEPVKKKRWQFYIDDRLRIFPRRYRRSF